MTPEPRPNWEFALYCLVALAVLCGAFVICGEIREACRSLSGMMEGAAR